MSKPINVLFTHYGDEWIRGSETVLLDLLGALNQDRVRPVVWCNGAAMAEAVADAGYPVIRDEFHHALDYSSPTPNLSVFRGLVRKCKALCHEHDIQVLHANSAAPVQWLVPAGFSERLPVLAHLHIDYLRRSRYVLLVHAATRIVGVSRQVNDTFVADGVASERLQVIYNGVDFARLGRSPVDLRATLRISPDAFVITTAGSLIERKGHDILLRAFHEVGSGPQSPHLLIPSDGPERKPLEALAKSLDIAERVHFLGYVDDITQLYQAADAFALASRGDAFGLVLAEAGHFGLPVVSTRVGGIPEVIAHGETGLLVPPDNVAAFSAALNTLMFDVALRKRMGDAAVTRVDQLFSAERMARQFEDTYTELAALPAAALGWGSFMRRLRPYGKLLSNAGRKQGPRYDA
jgi:glycosyltransferase involved in cell wall biosynthesis